MTKSHGFGAYYKLAKPGIVYGNVFTTIAAFLFVTPWRAQDFSALHFLVLFVATVLGIAFVIGSACVFNNYLDREIDRKMSRTKERALVTGTISVKSALVYGIILGLFGLELLYAYVNILTALLALLGFIFYVIVYGYAKRKSHWGTVVGSISGAVPIVVGYTAVTNRLDTEALILFLILALWQMPHFYAIATYRLQEYKEAQIPVLPAEKGIRTTKFHIVGYIIAFIMAELLLVPYFQTGYAQDVYLISVVVFAFRWLKPAIQGLRLKTAEEDAKWAKKIFILSLVTLVAFSVTIAVAPLFSAF